MMTLTIFTPTYNRINLLPRVYESLKNQTRLDFTWLIVDDGSTDDTGNLVKQWQQENIITIRYAYYENGGKMRAHNRGVELCETDLFLCVDSDDHLVGDAVESILNYADELEDDSIAGIVAHKGKSETDPLYDVQFPDVHTSTLYGLYLKGFKGETTLIYKTKVLREYPFPEIEGEKYVPEDYIYDKIDEKYALLVLPRIITVCEIVSEGYTDSVKALKRNNPVAWYLYYEQRARITPMSVLKLKYLGFYVYYAGRCGKPVFKGSSISPIFVLMGYPLSWLIKLTGKE